MNVLIDTNIIIPLEDTNCEMDERLASMKRRCSEGGIILRTHPSQREDILRDRDENRQRIVLSRLEQYSPISNPPAWTDEELNRFSLSQSNDNDRVDNALLCSVFRNASHLLITEDRRIHRKARLLNVQDRVHYLDQFLVFLETRDPNFPISAPPLGIAECFLYELRIEDSFFDSLRSSYSGFDEWFARCSLENRKGWVVRRENDLLALAIRKIETDVFVTQDRYQLRGRCLKLCTFKVSPQWRGRKIGERLLHTAFIYAINNGISWVYMTVHGDEQQMLISLCEQFGFDKIGTDVKGRDAVYCKDMREPVGRGNLSAIEYAIKHFPFYIDDDSVNRWIIPIRPEYHNMLFPDISPWKDDLFKDDPSLYGPFSNTIKKAYLCHSKANRIKSGDILYFYRSRDRKSVECVCVVEHAFQSSNFEEIAATVSKRTVYSQREIRQMSAKTTLVILFRVLKYIPPISRSDLERRGIRGNIQSIRGLDQSL